MTALALKTVPAYPLGIPVDGRPRYGMTPEMACLYRWLVKYRPHNGPFAVSFREAALAHLTGVHNIHLRVTALVERGWLKKTHGRYSFVKPIRHFAEPR